MSLSFESDPKRVAARTPLMTAGHSRQCALPSLPPNGEMKQAEEEADTGSSCSRWKITSESKGMLEREFHRKRFPSPRSKKRLAEELDVEPRRIQVWFQNRRQREKSGSELEPPRGSELKSSLERYPPRDSQCGFAQVGYGTSPSYAGPMLRESAFREKKEDTLPLSEGHFPRRERGRQMFRPESDMQSDFSSDMGDNLTSQTNQDMISLQCTMLPEVLMPIEWL
ncbi:MAG: hypothetical protein SGPRY_014232 [Prymnesium sp.]